MELALAKALEASTAADRFDAVGQIARELELRQLAGEDRAMSPE